MITGQVIDTLYKKFNKRPATADDLDISLLFEGNLADFHNLTISPEDELIVGSVDPASPFHAIPMGHIHGLVEFEKWLAVVLHSSIIFLSKESSKVSLNIKPIKRTFFGKLRDKLSND